MGATPGLVRPLIQANTVDGGTVQQDGQIVGLNDGGYVIIYNDQSPAFTTGQTIVGQRFDAAGNKVGAELRVSAFDDGQDSVAGGSSITKLPNGNIAFAYTDLFQGDNDVWVRVLNPALGIVRDDAIDTGSAQTKNASITAFANGSYAVSYTLDNGGGNRDILAKIVSANGAVGAPITVRDNGATDADFSQLATLSNNTFVDVYQRVVGSDHDISFAIYTSTGTPVVSFQQVFGGSSVIEEVDPDVAALAGGGFVVGWTDAQGDGDGPGLRMSIYDNAGQLVAGDIQINTTFELIQQKLSLAALQDGGFVATWEDDGLFSVERGQRFDATGHAIGGEFIVKEFGGSVNRPVDSLDAALLSSGRFAYALGDHNAGDNDVTTSIWTPNVNDAPVITSDGGNWWASLSVAENSTAVTTVTASDPDGPSPLTFAILTGPNSPDAAKFTINPSTGALAFITAPDFEAPSDSDHENNYVVQVGASDGNNLSDTQIIFVEVTDVASVITGTIGPDTLNGTAEDDTIRGLAGNDTLSGGPGSNTLIGGAGDDSYVVVSLGDTVTENPNEGNDLLFAGVSGLTLPANVETLWLTGAATSGFGNNAPGNTLIGNGSQDSTITGGASGDLMIGSHTSSKTTMVGGSGDDSYVTFKSADVVQENGSGGNDTVYAAVDFVQPANVETLWLVGAATQGTGNDSGGTLVANNNLSSTITGGASADLLVGAHNVTSTLQGGGGNDTYVVFMSGDTVQENPGAGNDIVYSTADFVLPNNVETLWLIGGATHATGNSAGGTLVANNNLNSILTGGSGSDLLVGGHSSVTTMVGGQGNDTYVSFVAGDIVQEAGNGGNDSLVTYGSQTIPTNVETMFLAEGAGPINGTGASGIDTIIGNAFDNVLDGGGNLDVLVGDGGADTFVFNAGEAVGDIVTDFTSGQDHLKFLGYGAGTLTQLDATHWQVNSADGFIHDTITLQNGAALHVGDFLFV